MTETKQEHVGLTQEQRNAYRADGAHCPLCGGLVQMRSGFEYDNEGGFIVVQCEKCGRKFNEVLKLVDIELID